MDIETENWLDSKEKIEWYCRKKSFFKKITDLFFEETVDKHFGLGNYKSKP